MLLKADRFKAEARTISVFCADFRARELATAPLTMQRYDRMKKQLESKGGSARDQSSPARTAVRLSSSRQKAAKRDAEFALRLCAHGARSASSSCCLRRGGKKTPSTFVVQEQIWPRLRWALGNTRREVAAVAKHRIPHEAAVDAPCVVAPPCAAPAASEATTLVAKKLCKLPGQAVCAVSATGVDLRRRFPRQRDGQVLALRRFQRRCVASWLRWTQTVALEQMGALPLEANANLQHALEQRGYAEYDPAAITTGEGKAIVGCICFDVQFVQFYHTVAVQQRQRSGGGSGCAAATLCSRRVHEGRR